MKPSRTKMPPKIQIKPTMMTPARSKQALTTSRDRDPVQVYCRIRPLDPPNQESCVTVLSETTVQVVPPEASQGYKSGPTKATQYTFTGVFDDNVSQKKIFQTVTLPLIEDLLHAKNSLLFAYGVTGSGKTHTMNGELQDGGIIPRCLDVIFNSIGHHQAKKYIFKPDKMNSFEIQSEVDALAERQADQQVFNKFKTPARKAPDNESHRIADSTKITAIDDDQTYAVFVTFVEVYNNTIFDLLDDTPIDPLRPGRIQSKILREDQHKNMYVHCVTEVEVKSAEEAAEILAKGQKRRRVAHTTLNAESSRSHSVFNIRVVQAPLDYQGASPEKFIAIGQLSLVDLAGSERNSRTKTTGERLREAGSINNTLMTLRSCIETLRENQHNGTNKMVPYRDSKITHLFKSYFDGEGKVRMIVCVNPRSDDHDETLSVMRFAEMAQEIQIARAVQPNIRVEATPKAPPASGLLPGRRKANRVLTEAYKRVEQAGIPNPQSEVPFDIDMVFSAVRCAWPPLELQSASDDQLINNLVEFLQVRIREQQNRREHQMKKCVEVRNIIASMEEELTLKRHEVLNLRAEINTLRAEKQAVENRLMNAEAANGTLQRHISEHQRYARLLEEDLKEKEHMLNQGEMEIQCVKAKEKSKRALEREMLKRELEGKRQIEAELQEQRERFKVMRDLIDAGCNVRIPSSSSESDCRTPSVSATPRPRASEAKPTSTPSLRGPAVATRKRRSRSVDPGEGWLDHRPPRTLELDTVLQPQMPRAKSITKLVDAREVTDPKVSKYVLTHQEQDSAGEIETKIYKGDILTTVGGGAQVVLQEVETLRRSSPGAVKRNSEGRPIAVSSRIIDIENRCAVAIEGHGRSKKQCP